MDDTVPDESGSPSASGSPPENGSRREGRSADGSHPLLARLQSLQEMQSALQIEEREEEILRVGVTATVEILGADCGLAVLEPGQAPSAPAGPPGLRCGSSEGRSLARHEIEIFCRGLEETLRPIREGIASRILLAAGSAGPREGGISGDPPAAFQARGIRAVLVQTIGNGAARRGVLVVGKRDPGSFSRETILLVEILANQIMVHLERSRRAAEAHRATDRVQEEVERATRDLRERNRELVALNDIASIVSPSFDLARQLEAALRKAAEITGHAAGSIYLVDSGADGREVLRFARGLGEPVYLERARAQEHARGQGVAGRVWESGEPATLADLAADPEMGGCEALASAGYRGLISLPVRARGRTVGVLEMLATGVRIYSDGELGLAQAIADQIGFAVQNTRLFSDIMRYSLELEGRSEARARDLEARERQMRALVGLIEAASRGSGPGDLLERALHRALEFVGVECGAAFLAGPGGSPLRLATDRGLPPELHEALVRAGPGELLLARAAEAGDLVTASETAEGAQGIEGALVRAGLRFAAALPLRSGAGLQAILLLAAAEEPILGQEERALLAAFADLAGLALETARTHDGGREASGGARADAGGAPARPAEMTAQLLQSQKMESIGTLAGGIAHDFNNIIGAILGYATYIKGLVTRDNPIFRQAATIEEQAKRAADLTQQLLAFARGGQYTLESVDMNRMVAEAVSLLSRSLDRNITLEVHTEPDLPAVEADAGQIMQLLLNVAVNAKQALPQGGRIVFETRVAHLDEDFVRAAHDLKPGDYVEVIIGDNGVGMPSEVVDRVFEPFFTTKAPGEGTGLGLAAVFGIARNHRGHVTLSSTEGVGTTVRIYLPSGGRQAPARPSPEAELGKLPPEPLEPPRETKEAERATDRCEIAPEAGKTPTVPAPRAEAAAAPSAGGEGTGVNQAPGGAGGRVLVVDDEHAIREVASDILRLRGYEVVLARDGVEALEVYREHWGRIDLVLLDMVMPRLGGLETYRRLVGMDRNVRVLLCSGFSHNEQAQRAIKEGAVGLLTKPFTMTELLAWMDRIMRRTVGSPSPAAARRGGRVA